jgi:hypothetical protein
VAQRSSPVRAKAHGKYYSVVLSARVWIGNVTAPRPDAVNGAGAWRQRIPAAGAAIRKGG